AWRDRLIFIGIWPESVDPWVYVACQSDENNGGYRQVAKMVVLNEPTGTIATHVTGFVRGLESVNDWPVYVIASSPTLLFSDRLDATKRPVGKRCLHGPVRAGHGVPTGRAG
ncbi:hypothetical protein, partial [Pantoea ananatis]